MSEPSPHEKGLYRVMTWGTALAFGLLAALAVSMKDFLGGNAAFHFSVWSVLAFTGGCAAGLLFWRFIFSKARKSTKNKQSDST
jgi:hypothetical protein